MPEKRSRKLTEQEKFVIIWMRESGHTFKQIGIALGLPTARITCFHSRFNFNRDLPPRPVIRNLVTNGAIGRCITDIVADDNLVSIRDIPAVLEAKHPGAKTSHRTSKESRMTKHRTLQQICGTQYFETTKLYRKSFCAIMKTNALCKLIAR